VQGGTSSIPSIWCSIWCVWTVVCALTLRRTVQDRAHARFFSVAWCHLIDSLSSVTVPSAVPAKKVPPAASIGTLLVESSSISASSSISSSPAVPFIEHRLKLEPKTRLKLEPKTRLKLEAQARAQNEAQTRLKLEPKTRLKLEPKAAKGKTRLKLEPLPARLHAKASWAVLFESPTRVGEQSASLPGSVEEMSAEETTKTDLLPSAESTSGISAAAGETGMRSNDNELQARETSVLKSTEEKGCGRVLEDAANKEKLLAEPSDPQIKTFQQRAWSSKKFQIDLHEWVAEMFELRLIDEEDEKTLYHRIHQRDSDIIRAIIEIATIDDEETRTDEESKKKELKENKDHNLTNLKGKLGKTAGAGKPGVQVSAGVQPFLSASLPFKKTSRNLSRMRTAHILQVPGTGKKEEDILNTGTKEEDILNVRLVRYFVENVWKLERPDVIISVTGGASKNFDLRPEYNEKLMRGMMEGTRKLKTWSVSIYVCICFCPFVVIAS
jgi:hypothetical protein